MQSPRDRFLTVMGRKPVIEALHDESLEIDKVLISSKAQGAEINTIAGMAMSRKIAMERVSEQKVTAVARSSRHHQGVVADVVAPEMQHLSDFCEQRRRGKDWACSVLVLDHVHNPANVGMILRSATAAGVDGVVVPHKGTADIGPVAIKASAGVAFKAPILRCEDMAEAMALLVDHRFAIVGLDAGGESIVEATLPERAAFVIGNESDGLSVAALAACDQTLSIPVDNGVESLNAAVAASLVAYEIRRNR
ncbi:MAG: RNA methyltransferase [Acidimicrobiales bacterium]|nr:RNA methyltransferase [Acidimicrobiales bacterium]RZV48846.1 MAG: RNA methyltransferase [Acidimicrobiales bacterium]